MLVKLEMVVKQWSKFINLMVIFFWCLFPVYPATPGGAILDLGIYAFQLASMVYGGQQPTSVSTSGYLLDSGK